MDQPLRQPDDHAEIREEVGKLCARFPGEYWRELDCDRAYPTEFVQALTEAGYLGALIPEEYGGAGLPLSAAAAILEEIHRSGGNAAACHAQMYIMGTILRHGAPEQKRAYLPKIATGELRLQAFGVTEPTSGTDTTALRTFAKQGGRQVRRQRPEDLDQPGRAFRPDAAARAHHAARPGGASGRRGSPPSSWTCRRRSATGLTIRPIRTMMNHNTTEIFFDNMEVPAENLVGEEGRGFRYILDGMNAERLLIAAECVGDAKWFIEKAVDYAQGARAVRPADRPEPGRAVPDRPRLCADARGGGAAAARAWRSSRRGSPAARRRTWARCSAADAAWAAAEACIQTHGGFGFAEEYDVERKYREARLYQVAPISTNLILSYVGEHVLGMPRSY